MYFQNKSHDAEIASLVEQIAAFRKNPKSVDELELEKLKLELDSEAKEIIKLEAALKQEKKLFDENREEECKKFLNPPANAEVHEPADALRAPNIAQEQPVKGDSRTSNHSIAIEGLIYLYLEQEVEQGVDEARREPQAAL